MMAPEGYFTVDDLMKRMCVSRGRIYQWFDAGCPRLQLGGKWARNWIPEAEFFAWLKRTYGRGDWRGSDGDDSGDWPECVEEQKDADS